MSSPSKVPLPIGDLGPILQIVPSAHSSPYPKQPFLQGLRSWQTYRLTDRPCYSICSNRPHLTSAECGLKTLPRLLRDFWHCPCFQDHFAIPTFPGFPGANGCENWNGKHTDCKMCWGWSQAVMLWKSPRWSLLVSTTYAGISRSGYCTATHTQYCILIYIGGGRSFKVGGQE